MVEWLHQVFSFVLPLLRLQRQRLEWKKQRQSSSHTWETLLPISYWTIHYSTTAVTLSIKVEKKTIQWLCSNPWVMPFRPSHSEESLPNFHSSDLNCLHTNSGGASCTESCVGQSWGEFRLLTLIIIRLRESTLPGIALNICTLFLSDLMLLKCT